MSNTDGFYIDPDVREKLKEACKQRGDKSRIINEALRQYFLPKTEQSTPLLANVRVKL